MSAVADLIEARQDELTRCWTEKVRQHLAPTDKSQGELEDTLPDFLRNLLGALRGLKGSTARIHGQQRHRLGFDVNALVREYGLLRGCILDLIEETGCPVTLAELRALTDFIDISIAEAVSEHDRQRTLAESAAAETHLEELREREASLSTTLSSIGDAVIATDASGRITFLNPVAETLTGWSQREVQGQPLAHVFHIINERTRAPVDSPVERVLEDGVVVGLANHTLLVRKDGTEVPIDDSAAPIRNGSGTMTGVVLVFRDVTERKRAEEERERLLKEVEVARGRLHGLIENAPAFVCSLRGPRHVFDLVNPLYQRLVGAERKSLGLPVSEALPEVVGQGFIQLLDGVYRTGEPFIGRETFIRLDRNGDGRLEEAFLNFVYQPRRDANGQVEGIDVFGFEVTEQVRARQRAEALTQRLRVSEERLRRVVEASGAGLWELAPTTGHIEADARMVALMGLAPGTTFSLESGLENVPVEDREHVARAVAAALAGENGGAFHMVFRTGGWGDVPLRWVESRAQVLSDAEGNAVALAGAMLDITPRMHAETERKAAHVIEARLSRHHALGAQVGLALSRGASIGEMLQGCVDAIVSQMGATLARIWLFNPKENMFELQASAGMYTHVDGAHGRMPLGQYEVGLIAEGKKPHLSNAVVGDPRVGDQDWARREGMVAFAGYPLLVADRLVGVVALFSRQPLARDTFEALQQVADSIALGIERLRAESELRKRIDFEQQLIGIVSHDLRNPLSAIHMGATLLARREELDARAAKSVVRIQASAERAIRMVKNLLDFTQARLGGGIPIEPRPADVHEVTRSMLEEVESAYPTRELEVQHEGDGRGEWDADRLAQVVQNLVTNALKYSPEDSLVRVSTRGEDGWVSCSVSNRGAPIPADKLPGIFEPLQRATDEVDRTGRSVGLGLYIVKRLVDAHGGTVTVTSTEAEGTLFTVRLPRKRT